MGKAAMMVLLAYTITAAYGRTSSTSTRMNTEHSVGRHQTEVLARDAALAGFESAKQALAGTFGTRTFNGTYGSAAYSVGVGMNVAGDTARLRSTGSAVDGRGQTVRYTVSGRVAREAVYSMADVPPPFMQYALLVEGDLTLGGDILVDTFRVVGDTSAANNANIHTNRNLRVNGAAALVRGFGTYTGSANVNRPERIFRPYDAPTGASTLNASARVDIPAAAFSAPAIALAAGGAASPRRTTTGSAVLSGTYDFRTLGATRENPYVWYVTGNLSVSGNVLLHGYVVFVVAGDITLGGNARAGLADGPAESHVAWYAGNDVTLQGNGEIWGQIFAKDDVTFQGTPQIYGSVTVGDQATIGGNPKLYNVSASPALTRHWQAPEFRLRLAGYSEGW